MFSKFMNRFAFVLLCIIILMGKLNAAKSSPQVNSKQTIVKFLVPDKPKNKNELIKFSMTISEKDPSLFDAIEQARQLQSNLRNIYKQFCQKYEKEELRQKCQQFVDCSDYEIKAQYYHLRGQQTFKNFVVEFEIQFITSAVGFVGQLIDDLSDQMSGKKMVLGKIIWQDSSQDSTIEELMDEGMSRAKSTCKNLGMRLHRIKSVQIYTGKPEEQEKKPEKKKKQAEEQGQQEEQQQQQQKPEQDQEQQQKAQRYKFVVVCRQNRIKKSTAKKLINLAKKAGGKKAQKSAKALLK